MKNLDLIIFLVHFTTKTIHCELQDLDPDTDDKTQIRILKKHRSSGSATLLQTLCFSKRILPERDVLGFLEHLRAYAVPEGGPQTST
jgi:hypothetical protein